MISWRRQTWSPPTSRRMNDLVRCWCKEIIRSRRATAAVEPRSCMSGLGAPPCRRSSPTARSPGTCGAATSPSAVRPRRYGQHAFSEGRAVVRVARKHGLDLEAFSGGTLRGPFDWCAARGWRWSSGAMDRLGRLLTTGLETADLVKVRPAQVFAARLVRRFYRVGGMTRESGSGIRAEARPDGI